MAHRTQLVFRSGHRSMPDRSEQSRRARLLGLCPATRSGAGPALRSVVLPAALLSLTGRHPEQNGCEKSPFDQPIEQRAPEGLIEQEQVEAEKDSPQQGKGDRTLPEGTEILPEEQPAGPSTHALSIGRPPLAAPASLGPGLGLKLVR